MKLQIVAVFDSAAQAYSTPAFVSATGLAVRQLSSDVNRASDAPIFTNPDDFELYHLGEFDDETGIIFSLSSPILLARAKDLAVRLKVS